jgi:hypothetical protein
MNVIPTEILDKDGNLERIEFHNEMGSFEIQAVWDTDDEQTSENRARFREWAYRFLENNKGYNIIK